MTEAEWQECDDAERPLSFLRGDAGYRKLRLLSCAMARRAQHLIPAPGCLAAIEAAELYADGLLAEEGCVEAADAFDEVRRSRYPAMQPDHDDAWTAVYIATHRRWQSEHDGYFGDRRWELAWGVAKDAVAALGPGEAAAQAVLTRCVFGSPFRPIGLDPALRTPLVVSLGKAAYEERLLPSGHLDPQRLAVLADAIEETGHRAAGLIDHLRVTGPHVRGCFAVDTCLGLS
jgi:hypothetical protein